MEMDFDVDFARPDSLSDDVADLVSIVLNFREHHVAQPKVSSMTSSCPVEEDPMDTATNASTAATPQHVRHKRQTIQKSSNITSFALKPVHVFHRVRTQKS